MANNKKKYKSNLDAALLGLSLDRSVSKSLQEQLTDALRDMVLEGPKYSGARLPASRKLAEELSVSRTTVTSAYDQLISEGYLTTKIGGGTFIADNPPHLSTPQAKTFDKAKKPQTWMPFNPGVPDQNLFSHHMWARHLERAWRKPDAALLARQDPLGWYPLRKAIADHLSAWRGLQCHPEQIMITSGSWEAFEVIFRSLLTPKRSVAIEDPGWFLLRDVLASTGTKINPVRIGADGLDAADIPAGTSAMVVTPSRHYPTGTTMPLAQRAALLEWAKQTTGLIIEDDYDSEFRYKGQPLPSLTGLDGLQNTIYLGSFSKLLSPALRIGYMVIPKDHLEPVRKYVRRIGARASLIPQPALETFMSSGEFAVHLRRMRRTYAKRQSHLIQELSDVTNLLDVHPDPSGMHLCVPLRAKLLDQVSDRDIVTLGQSQGLSLRALSAHSFLPKPPQGLILGYAAFDETQLSDAAQKLIGLLRNICPV